MRILKIFLVVVILSGLSGLLVSLPDCGKAEETPQEISVANLASHGPGNNIYVQLTDFDFGSHAVTETRSGKSRFSKVIMPLFPKGKADDSHASVVVTIVPHVTNDQELKEFCKRTSLLGIVRDNSRARLAREAVAKNLPGLNTASAPVVFLYPALNPASLFWLSIAAIIFSGSLLLSSRFKTWIRRKTLTLKESAQLKERATPKTLKQSHKIAPPRMTMTRGLIDLGLMAFSILSGQWYTSRILEAAKHNDDVFIFWGILTVIPGLFVVGLCDLISPKLKGKEKVMVKVMVYGSVAIALCWYIWLQGQLAQYGFE